MGDGTYAEPAKPFARWSGDTELAFLHALRRTGQVRKAASEIGRSTAGAYGRRKRYPVFAAAWDAAVAQQQADWIAAQQLRLEARGSALDLVGGDGANGGGRLTPAREREDGWNVQKRGFFLRTLRQTKSVKKACEVAEVSDTAAYRLRARSPAFAAAWERALMDARAPSVLEAAVARAVDGWDEPIVQGGKVVAYRKRYSEALMRDLLRAERGEDEQWNPARQARLERAEPASLCEHRGDRRGAGREARFPRGTGAGTRGARAGGGLGGLEGELGWYRGAGAAI